MKKNKLFAAIILASGLVFSTGALADDTKSGQVPLSSSGAEQGGVEVRQRNQAGAVKQEKQHQGEQNNSSTYGEEYWEKDPQLHLWEQQDFVQSWHSDC